MMLNKLSIASLIALTSISYSSHADTLLEIYQAAKLNDSTILKSKAQYDSFLEKVNEANASLLPQIGFSADTSYNATNNDYSYGTYGATISLSQSLYNSSYWQQLDLAEKEATQYEVIYNISAQDLLLRTATAYFNVLRADEAVKSVQANKRAVERQLEQTKQRFEVGLIAITDVHEAQAEYDRTVADEINAENTLLNSYYTLHELTGEEVKNVAQLNTNTFSTQQLEGDIKTWRSTSLEHNLTLHSKRIAKELAKMQIDLAKAGNKPTLALTAGLDHHGRQYNDSDVDSNFSSSSYNYDNLNTGTIGLELSVPLYTGGKTNSLVKQAQYNYVMASEDLNSTYRSTESEVSSGFNNVRASISSIRAYEQTVKSSSSALEAVEAGFEVGTRTIVDVLDATRSLYDSENELANARYDYIINMLNLKFSAGTLKEQDIIDISAGLIQQ
ncbi:outer membrane channel protein TolC [Psychromonas sp. PT13]|uniref:outer membrane channel protein TolC n=1 Tax=Psychromonas sp. PT13 TaxID=3439547 RepID=UPI003EBB540F